MYKDFLRKVIVCAVVFSEHSADSRSSSCSPSAAVAGHRLQAGDAVGHRRVGGEQPHDALAAERVRDHQVADATQPAVLRQRQRRVPASSLRRAPARASGSPVSWAPDVVRLVLAGAADRQLDDQRPRSGRAPAAGARRGCRRPSSSSAPPNGRNQASWAIQVMTAAIAPATEEIRMSRL